MSQTLVEKHMIGQELSFSTKQFDSSAAIQTPTQAASSSPEGSSDQTENIECAANSSLFRGSANNPTKLELPLSNTRQTATSACTPIENGSVTLSPNPFPDGSPRSDHTSQSHQQHVLDRKESFSRKPHARTDELRKMFGLDPTEQLIDDYVCALKKKILLQGRMYIFENHICFSSSLFGYHKVKVIPFTKIGSITRRKNVGFPNSIEVVWDNGATISKKEFFTSFLKREEAFKHLVHAWAKISDLGKEFLSLSGMNTPIGTEEEDNGRGGRSTSVADAAHGDGATTGTKRASRTGKNHRSKRGEISDLEAPSPHNNSNDLSPLDRSPSPGAGGRYVVTPFSHLHQFTTTAAATATPTPTPGNQRDGSQGDGDGSSSSLTMQVTVSNIDPLYDHQNSLILTDEATSSYRGIPPSASQSRIPEFEEIPSSAIDPSALLKEFDSATEPAPPVPPHMQRVMGYTLPTTPEGFFQLFLSPESDFCIAFHEAQGHHSIRVSSWQRHFQVGPVRDLRFVTPLKKGWRLGPPQTLCHQTQRFRVYQGKHLVFETSQVMSDIPYGDHFTVDTRWDVVPLPTLSTAQTENTCEVQVSISVPFSKNTMWKKFIERGVTDSSLEAYQMFRELAEGQLAKEKASRDDNIDADKPLSSFDQGFEPSLTPSPSTGNSGVIPDIASLPTRPVHRRVASRPSSPEELLPSTNEEWEALLSHIEPKFKGYIKALRRAQMVAGNGGGGSSPPLLLGQRHRRRGSAAGRSADWTSHQLGSGAAVGDGVGAGMIPSPSSSPVTLPRVPEGQTFMGLSERNALAYGRSTRSKAGQLASRVSLFVRAHGWMICICMAILIVCLQARVLMSASSGNAWKDAAGTNASGGNSRSAAARELNVLLSQVQMMQRQLSDVSEKARKLQSMLN